MSKKINAEKILGMILKFLQLLMTQTLAKRITSMALIAAGVPDSRVTELTGLCDRSVRELRRALENDETENIFQVGGGGSKSKLAGLEETIINEVESGSYSSRQQIADMINEKHGIKVSLNTISRLLKKNGIKRLKSGSLPAKADPKAQRLFYEKTLLPLMQKAKNGTIALLFVDASHFVMGCDYLGYIYGKVRRFIRTHSGRSRYNVLGALDFVSKKITTITNDTYITATEVCELIRKVSLEYAGMPVFLILDNARYQKCLIVQALAAELNVTLVYIPAYSPNLNLIERFWKHAKSRLRIKYYNDFNDFKEKIDLIIAGADKGDKAIVDRFIGEKVQLFDNTVFDNVVELPKSKNAKKYRKKAA